MKTKSNKRKSLGQVLRGALPKLLTVDLMNDSELAACARAVVRAHNARYGPRIKWETAEVAKTWKLGSVVLVRTYFKDSKSQFTECKSYFQPKSHVINFHNKFEVITYALISKPPIKR